MDAVVPVATNAGPGWNLLRGYSWEGANLVVEFSEDWIASSLPFPALVPKACRFTIFSIARNMYHHNHEYLLILRKAAPNYLDEASPESSNTC